MMILPPVIDDKRIRIGSTVVLVGKYFDEVRIVTKLNENAFSVTRDPNSVNYDRWKDQPPTILDTDYMRRYFNSNIYILLGEL